MCIFLTCIASPSQPTKARANTHCWNNRHITACITFTLLWSHQQAGAVFTGLNFVNAFVFESQNVKYLCRYIVVLCCISAPFILTW